MEACVGAHHLSRRLKMLGHDARLMPAKYVRPYSKGQKNDFRDAETIAEAKTATSRGWDRSPNRSRPATERSLAAYQSAAIALCAPCSFRWRMRCPTERDLSVIEDTFDDDDDEKPNQEPRQ
jgi:hypothetical protein